MSEEKPGQYLTIRQDKNPGAFGKWSIPGLEQSFELDGGDGLFTGKPVNRKNGSI